MLCPPNHQAGWNRPALPYGIPRTTLSSTQEKYDLTKVDRPCLAGRMAWLVGCFRKLGSLLDSTWQWCFGLFSLLVVLAILATIPGLQFLSVGYLLEAGGRVARTGTLRAGFIGVRKAARAGSLMLGTLLLLLPLRLAQSLRTSSIWIDPKSPATLGWTVAVGVIGLLTVWIITAAMMRGGRIGHFFWPRLIHSLRQAIRPGAYGRARDAVWEAVSQLHLSYYFWLGFRGVIGGICWLVVPITLMVVGDQQPILGVLGSALLVMVILVLPFLQVRMAAENRFGALFEIRPVRQAYRRAPLAFSLALLMTLVLAIPLYLLKIELIPQEAAWLPSLLFVLSIFPARLLSGWALSRAARQEFSRHWILCWGGRICMLLVALAYAGLVYLTRLVSWYGVWSLYEQHAFLVPAPFLGLE